MTASKQSQDGTAEQFHLPSFSGSYATQNGSFLQKFREQSTGPIFGGRQSKKKEHLSAQFIQAVLWAVIGCRARRWLVLSEPQYLRVPGIFLGLFDLRRWNRLVVPNSW